MPILKVFGGYNTRAPAKLSEKIVEKSAIKIGLALGGGAARGFAHIGVIKMLEANNIKPDIVVGTSAGAMVGALYAGGLDAQSIQLISDELDVKVFADWGLPRLGLLKGEYIAEYINNSLNNLPIEKLKIHFAALATDLQSGEVKLFQSGNTGDAVRASTAVPGVFQPPLINGRLYVDGGLVSPVPVQALKNMGANLIIAVDISTKPQYQPIDSIANILRQTISIMGEKISKNELKIADFLITPDTPYIKSWDFNSRNLAIIEGERAALKVIPKIIDRLRNEGVLLNFVNNENNNLLMSTDKNRSSLSAKVM